MNDKSILPTNFILLLSGYDAFNKDVQIKKNLDVYDIKITPPPHKSNSLDALGLQIINKKSSKRKTRKLYPYFLPIFTVYHRLNFFIMNRERLNSY